MDAVPRRETQRGSERGEPPPGQLTNFISRVPIILRTPPLPPTQTKTQIQASPMRVLHRDVHTFSQTHFEFSEKLRAS
jgi:hypothetical protein